jgi:hypothetical protein
VLLLPAIIIAGVVVTGDKLIAPRSHGTDKNPEQGFITGVDNTGDNL